MKLNADKITKIILCNSEGDPLFSSDSGVEIENIGIRAMIDESSEFPPIKFEGGADVEGGTIHLSNVYVPPKGMIILLGKDVFKDKPNNWRRVHGLTMRRRMIK